ncbi:hypothetical protein QBC34DRAFT_181211 [Podospora aff. communis PSN243]|uniref:PEX20 peroxisomal biogenesis factor 20 n=1 Tax=Podospora aff. communis PSN243 TaxID=3040156 RepID=A0AAV9G772_9PEZI|nr:hypothetical protein QBC34DRAFT_181211 [Podospora aff. communis PSN243]
MADNLCGPSNGAKNLVNHVNRDRSLQQDRLVGGTHSISESSFRSQSANARAADRAFGGFQRNGLPAAQLPMGPSPAGLVGDIHAAIPAAIPAQSMAAGPHGFSVQHSQGPSWAGSAPPAVAGGSQDWVNQFSSMQVGGESLNRAASATPRHQSPGPLFQAGGMNATAHLGFVPPAFARGLQGMYGPSPMLGHNAYGGQQQSASLQNQESRLDIEAFNAAFGAYDDAEFSQELASWAEKKKEVAEATENARSLEKLPLQNVVPVVEEAVQQERNKEEQEAARRRREDEELARAANSILSSVSGMDSEKFKNSNFFELMRQIGNREVVVEGPNLVDAATGETVVPKDPEDQVPALGDEGAMAQPTV